MITKEMPLKLYGFIVRDKGINFDIPEKIDLTLAFDTNEAFKNLTTQYKAAGVSVTIKNCLEMTYENFDKNVKETIKKLTPQSSVEPQPLVEMIVAEPILDDKKLRWQIITNIKMLLEDPLCQSIREKLTKTELNTLNKIIKKI